MPWITLRNKRRVKIDRQGRIVQGIAKDAKGVHVRDLSPFMDEYRDIEGADCSHTGDFDYETRKNGTEILRDARTHQAIPARFPRKEVAIEALLDANPELYEFVQLNWGSDSQEYERWMENHRRGQKPQLMPGDGRFDAINTRFNLTGPHRCSSMLEALYLTIPSTGLWEDLDPGRLWPLEEVTGLHLEPPMRSMQLPLVREMVTTCKVEHDERKKDLLDRAKSGRLSPRNVPF